MNKNIDYASLIEWTKQNKVADIVKGMKPLPKVKPWYKEPMHETPVQLTGLPKMPNGCCHKTVVTRCKDCSFNREPIDKK